MTPEQVRTMYGSAARDYSRPDMNTMVHKVFETGDETTLKRGYLTRRSMNGLNQYEIQLPRDKVANMRRDWPIAILNNGEKQTQVGAVIVAENGYAIAKFSRSENGQQARRRFETGEDALSIAYLKRASGRQPAAFSLRAVDGKSIRESDMSAKEIVALVQAHNITERAALVIAAGKNLEQF